MGIASIILARERNQQFLAFASVIIWSYDQQPFICEYHSPIFPRLSAHRYFSMHLSFLQCSYDHISNNVYFIMLLTTIIFLPFRFYVLAFININMIRYRTYFEIVDTYIRYSDLALEQFWLRMPLTKTWLSAPNFILYT